VKTKKFRYIDAMPGAGKTEYFVDEAVTLLTDPKPRQVLLYAAPSLVLLREAVARIRAHRGFKATYTGRIFLVATHTRVKGEALTRQDVTYYASPPVLVLNMLLGLLHPSIPVPDKPAREAQPGDVILTTHESFLQVYNRDVTGRDFAILAKTHVVFDEARQCVVAQNPMNGIRNSDFAKIMVTFDLGTPVLPVQVPKADAAKPWHVYQITGTTSLDHLKKVFDKDAVPGAIRTLHRTVKTYTESGRASVYMLVQGDLNTFALSSSQQHNASVYAILRPTSLFDHYGKVTLTSAFFTDSQLYHFLSRDGHTFVDLMRTDRSEALNRIRARDRQLREALPSRLIVGVLLASREHSSGKAMYRKVLTTNLLRNSMVVPRKLTNRIIGQYVSQDLSAKVIAANLAAGRRVSDNARFQATLRDYAVPPLWVLVEEADRLMRRALEGGYLPAGSRALLTVNKVGSQLWAPGDILYMKALEKFYIEGKLVSGTRDAYRSLASKEDVAQAASIPKIWQEKLRALMYHESSNFILPESPRLLGINLYQDLTAFVHLAALNPSPQLIHMYQTLLGDDYDIDQDHAIENLVQMLYRTNLRVADAQGKVLMIVPYKSNAELLRAKIGCADFRYVNEPRLTPWSYKKSVDPARRLEASKKAAEAAARTLTLYQDEDTKAKAMSINCMLSRARAKLKANPTDPKAQQRVADLLAKRVQLKQ